MDKPLMPKATAVWLIDNTGLTFDQIADFCGLHPLEVKGIADGEVRSGIRGLDPIGQGMVTREELERCQKDPKLRLKIARSVAADVKPPKRREPGQNRAAVGSARHRCHSPRARIAVEDRLTCGPRR